MPIYVFKCTNCNTQFEELCSMGTIEIMCPKCGSVNTKRQISSFGIGGKNIGSSGNNCGSCHSGHCHSCH